MAITHNDQQDVYGNPLQPRFGGDPHQFGKNQKALREAADTLYGRPGKFGLPMSVAETYIAEQFNGARGVAQASGHIGDLQRLEIEAKQLAMFAHANFTQPELQEFVRVFSAWTKPLTEVNDKDEQARSEADQRMAKAMLRKYGSVDADKVYAEADAAARRILATAPTFARTLHENGAADDLDVIAYLSRLALAKGWVVRPERQTLSFEPPRAA